MDDDSLTLICLTGVDEDHDPCNTHASWRLRIRALSFVVLVGSFLLQGVKFIRRGRKSAEECIIVVFDINSDV